MFKTCYIKVNEQNCSPLYVCLNEVETLSGGNASGRVQR